MKHSTKSGEPLYDPILAELYKTRDAYAREFNFDANAICDALERRKQLAAHKIAAAKKQATKPKSRRTGTRRVAV